MQILLDASAIVAYLRRESGWQTVSGLLKTPPPANFVHAVNLCEVFYDFLRSDGEAVASSAIDDLRTIGVIVREDLDEEFWRQAGRIKVHFHVPLADAIAAALAERLGAELVTTDRGDFERVAQAGICRVNFIR